MRNILETFRKQLKYSEQHLQLLTHHTCGWVIWHCRNYFVITNIIIIMSIVQGCISWSIYLLFRYPARLLQSVRRHLRMYCNEGSRHATIQVSSSVHTCAFSPANYRCHWQVLIVTAVHSLPNTSTFLSFSLQLHISFLTVKLSTVNQIFFVVSCHHDICL